MFSVARLAEPGSSSHKKQQNKDSGSASRTTEDQIVEPSDATTDILQS